VTCILLTNDDGIDAPGLRALEDVFSTADDLDIWVVAPSAQRSACSHGMTLGVPIRVEPRGERRFCHSGQVADGVYFALVHLLTARPALVISGINAGANLAEDVIYSGTVAGAREAVLRGVPGLAVSLTGDGDFQFAAGSTLRIARALMARQADHPLCLNVNFPPGPVHGPFLAPAGSRPYAPKVTLEPIPGSNGETGYRLGGPPLRDAVPEPGTDVALIARGLASMTPLRIDQTSGADLRHPVLASFIGPSSEG